MREWLIALGIVAVGFVVTRRGSAGAQSPSARVVPGGAGSGSSTLGAIRGGAFPCAAGSHFEGTRGSLARSPSHGPGAGKQVYSYRGCVHDGIARDCWPGLISDLTNRRTSPPTCVSPDSMPAVRVYEWRAQDGSVYRYDPFDRNDPAARSGA